MATSFMTIPIPKDCALRLVDSTTPTPRSRRRSSTARQSGRFTENVKSFEVHMSAELGFTACPGEGLERAGVAVATESIAPF